MGSKDDDDKELSSSRKFMIAAIFSLMAVVFLILLLHLYARYLLRRRERRRRAAIQQLSRQIAPDVAYLYSAGEPPRVGLEPSVKSSLPETNFKLDSAEPIECSVCLGNITEGNMVRILPNCKHMFHKDCIDIWFDSNTNCPICRTTVEPTVVQPEEKGLGSDQVQVQPSAPPLEEVEKDGGSSGLRFGSFRWMVSRERSSRVGSFEDEISAQDLERH